MTENKQKKNTPEFPNEDLASFRALHSAVAEALGFRQRLSEQAAKEWLRAADADPRQIAAALRKHAQHSTVFPTPAHVRAIIHTGRSLEERDSADQYRKTVPAAESQHPALVAERYR